MSVHLYICVCSVEGYTKKEWRILKFYFYNSALLSLLKQLSIILPLET